MNKKNEATSNIKDEKSKKNKSVFSLKDIIAIEEFFFVVERSIGEIKNFLSSRHGLTRYSDRTEARLRFDVNRFYSENKSTLYCDTDLILNGLVRFDSEKEKSLLDEFGSGCSNISDWFYTSFEGSNFYQKIDYMLKVYSIDCKYICLEKGVPLLQHFQDKDVINELRKLAESSIKKSKNKEEEISRVRENIQELRALYLRDQESDIPLVALKNWRRLLLEELENLLNCIIGKKESGESVRIRTLILKSFIESVGIKAKTDVDKQKFIANILNTTPSAVKSFFYDFQKEDWGLKDGEIEAQKNNAIKICEEIMNEDNPEGKAILKKMIDCISKAATPEYKNIK